MADTTLDEFIEDHSGGPYTIEEFADLATNVSDCDELVIAAEEFLEAKRSFDVLLQSYGIEVG